ncbi:MAG: D-glycerate dehydrogenase [Verrucomicrobiota bacterium]
MSKPAVINAVQVPDEYLEPLHGVATVVQPDHSNVMTLAELLAAIQSHEAVGAIIPGELKFAAAKLTDLPSLKVISNTAAGYNNLPLDELAEFGIWATNTPDAFVDATADAAFALILGLARKTVLGDQFVRSGEWAEKGIVTQHWEGMELRGKTIGIVGFGAIGKAVARRAEAFGMTVIYHRRTSDNGNGYRSLPDLLAESDIVNLHTPLTPETHHLINSESLAMMKRGALLMNLARGLVVHEAAMVEALKSGQLGGAGLDVFEQEPEVHPDLVAMPNVLLTPHLGGATREARKLARLTAAENVRRVIVGERPLSPLNEPSI